MNSLLRSTFISLLLVLSSIAHAALPLPAHLEHINSKAGQEYMHDSATKNTLTLLSHFTTQYTTTYCGVASLVMVLNSSGLEALRDTEHSDPDLNRPDKQFYYFNQTDFFNEKVTQIINPNDVRRNGITLNQLKQIAQSFGLVAKTHHADQFDQRDPQKALKQFREKLIDALDNNQFVIANFGRQEMGAVGGGHHSPLAAYDDKSDRFLLLDVARYKYPSYWVATRDLWKAVNTIDTDAGKDGGSNKRGILIMHKLKGGRGYRE